MPNISRIRVVRLATALNEVESVFARDGDKRSHAFVAVDRAIHEGKELELPPVFFERLPDDFSGDLFFAMTTLPELQRAGINMGRHREQFLAGEPIIVAVPKVHGTPEREQGGQDVVGLERRVRDGLYVTVALATEKLRACADGRERHRMKTETRREEIFDRLAICLPGLSIINLFREGQKLAGDWYPGRTSRDVLKATYNSVAAARLGHRELVTIEAEQVDLVGTAGAIYGKTLTLLKAQHEYSAMLRERMSSDDFKNAAAAVQTEMQARFMREQAPAHQQELAHDKHGGPTLNRMMQAAAAMDVNPAQVFSYAFSYKSELDCAMLLGRAERGIEAVLTSAHIARLKRFIDLADRVDADGLQADDQAGAARRLRDIALRIKSRQEWEDEFAAAEAAGGSIRLIKELK